jgi:excisionase family DNA binding protein
MRSDRKLLRVNEVAERLNWHPSSVYRAVSTGTMPAVRLGGPGCSIRIDESELERWLYTAAGGAMAPAISDARLGTPPATVMVQSNPKRGAGTNPGSGDAA